MKIDLHVHCKERSSCGKSSEEEQIQAAIDCGLDAICFTDHNQLMPNERFQMLSKKYAPFRVFGGIEVSIEEEHVIVLGIHDPCIEDAKTWTYPELYRFVRERGGFMALCHPFRYREVVDIELEAFPTDAIELKSNNTPETAAKRIYDISSHLGISVLCNSDSHRRTTIGKYYNILNCVPDDEVELIQMLKSGEFQCSWNK